MIRNFFIGVGLVLLVSIAIFSPFTAMVMLFMYFYAPLAFGVTVVALWEVIAVFVAMMVSLGILLAIYLNVEFKEL